MRVKGRVHGVRKMVKIVKCTLKHQATGSGRFLRSDRKLLPSGIGFKNAACAALHQDGKSCNDRGMAQATGSVHGTPCNSLPLSSAYTRPLVPTSSERHALLHTSHLSSTAKFEVIFPVSVSAVRLERPHSVAQPLGSAVSFHEGDTSWSLPGTHPRHTRRTHRPHTHTHH